MSYLCAYKKQLNLLIIFLMLGGYSLNAQIDTSKVVVTDSSEYARQFMKEQAKKWGPNDTVIVPAIWYNKEIINYREMDMAWVSNL